LNFGVKESLDKVNTGTVEKLTLENMGIAFEILSLDGTEPEIQLGGHLPPNFNVRFKKYHCNTRIKAKCAEAVLSPPLWGPAGAGVFKGGRTPGKPCWSYVQICSF